MSQNNNLKTQYTFIVAGGGTAGCTVAGRLADISPDITVLLIEAGKSSYGVKEIATPALATNLVESEFDWAYEATLVDRPDFKRDEKAITRGKVLGGSSSLNYYSWHRGSAATYDEWQAWGGPNWSWNGCKEYFSKPARLNQSYTPQLFSADPDDVGTKGPVKLRAVDPTPLSDAFISAWTSKGLPLAPNIFNGRPNGITNLLATVDDGERCNSTIFLQGRPNITVLTESRVGRIILSPGPRGSPIATGVEIVDSVNGKVSHVVHATNEVIVSSGVFASPHILLLSGIGPAEELKEHGVKCNVDSPHVGKHLQEHVIFAQGFHVKDGMSFDGALLRPGPLNDAAVREYEEHKTGPLASPLLQHSAWTRIDDKLAKCKEWVDLKNKLGSDPLAPKQQPHFEYDFVPVFFHPFQPHVSIPQSGDHMTIVTSFMRPLSRGRVTLKSNLPQDQPKINLNFFYEQVDLVAMREAARHVRNILRTGDKMRDIVTGVYPDDLADLDGDDEAANKLVLRRCSTGYHPCGTCRFGTESGEFQGVLDERLRVRGVENLRVIDASVVPIMPDCRIQAPVYMIAEKGAAMIREDYEQKIKLA